MKLIYRTLSLSSWLSPLKHPCGSVSCPVETTSTQTTFVPYLASVWRPPPSSTMKVSQTEAVNSCGMGSLVSPVVDNLYMEEVDSRPLISLTGTAPSHWFRYVDDAWVKIQIRKVEVFPEHMNTVDNNIKFTGGDVRGGCLPFLDCAVHTEEDRSLNI